METIKENGYTKISRPGLTYFTVAPGVWGMRIVFVNVYLIAAGDEGSNNFILVDAGLKGSGNKIVRMAEDIFGPGAKPVAIVLTHGHFDHVGSLEELLTVWNTPVYSHYLELPYLKGISSYPPPDPMVGGGLMSMMSWMFPKRPKDLGKRIHRLGTDDAVPGLPEWRFIHVPGHSPGQIALFREADRTLIAADAFVTTKQESAFSVITQKKQLSGPPKYFTIDWNAAGKSVATLSALEPETAATGHGYPVYGEELRSGLKHLAENFEKEAVPGYGRYVREPARANKNGVQYIPRKVVNPGLLAGAAVIGMVAAAGLIWGIRKTAKAF
ncbi:MBL fold metallo-hydrolase [Pararcticibacter amylolyticus]|uniref:MBL fold metallo-hydrolase n=1 Tax=Pararcticibacter amylolyticus TaxID=2173175 RepID=A0A2U2PKW2_9SPHI|nr:MBL fold metallo-hydrolase [Pararcticibacter amylolyticus]PWG82041.1 MBL fold metallo-hydrolase [Pararcticibacter amylolyticus]